MWLRTSFPYLILSILCHHAPLSLAFGYDAPQPDQNDAHLSRPSQMDGVFGAIVSRHWRETVLKTCVNGETVLFCRAFLRI